MRFPVSSALVTSAAAIALAIAAPPALARFDLTPSPAPSSQTTSAGPSVRPNPDEQTAQTGVAQPRLIPRPAAISQLAALDRAQAQDAKPLASNLQQETHTSNTARPTSVSVTRIPAPSGGFDWGAAGIGAAAAVGVMLAGIASTLLVRRRAGSHARVVERMS